MAKKQTITLWFSIFFGCFPENILTDNRYILEKNTQFISSFHTFGAGKGRFSVKTKSTEVSKTTLRLTTKR